MMPLKGWYFTVRLTAPDGSAPRDDRWRPVDQIEDIGLTNGTRSTASASQPECRIP